MLIVLGRHLDADLRVRALPLEVNRLADVVEQARALGQLPVHLQLRGHDRRQLGDLDRVHQDVLSIGGPITQPPERLHQLGMHVRDPELPERVLPRA